MKIVVTDADTVCSDGVTLDFLNKYGEATVYGLTAPDELAARIADADVVLCNKTRIGAPELATATHLGMIGLFATGYNNIDTAVCRSRGIAVCNVPGYSTEAVAQRTFALLLELTDRVAAYNETVERGDWVLSRTFSYFPYPTRELAGKTLGVVGYGAIGRRVAQIGKAFGMRVLAYWRHPAPDGTVTPVDFDTLLRESDVVSLHCPLNADSESCMDAAAFAAMKPGALFINTARGGLVDEAALRQALDSGRLGGAGLDVLRQEPMAADCPLRGAPRCVMTPHTAWAGIETRLRLMGVVEDNLRAFVAGTPINDVTAR